MNRRELSEVVAECAARTERARAGIEVARQRQEEALARQEAATARWEATQADVAERNKKLDGLLGKADGYLEKADGYLEKADGYLEKVDGYLAAMKVEREEEKIWRREYLRRQEKMFQEFFARAETLVAEGTRNTEKILAKIEDQGEDIRAMKEAILKLLDRFPPPPPHLRSA